MKNISKVKKLIPFLGALALGTQALATEIVSGTGNYEATLGSAYHSEQEAFGSANCINATVSTGAGKAEYIQGG